MIPSRLRIYFGPDEEHATATVATTAVKRETVTIPAGDAFELLADAIRHKRAWLRDFADDEITISTDLYEVILAYDHFRRPSA